MDRITSRKNAFIVRLRALASDAGMRREQGVFVCDGPKLLEEAALCGAEILSVLWKEGGAEGVIDCPEQAIAPAGLFDYVSPMKNSPGPLFSVRIREGRDEGTIGNAIVLENVQDPGNVGTVIRTANALGIDAVVLCGDCADLYLPKTVRATMGAIFRQRVLRMETEQLSAFLSEQGLALYGAALSEKAEDVRGTALKNCAVAVGSEGSGLSAALLAQCAGEIIIPMRPDSESLNAAVAAAILMWEIVR